MFSDEAMGLGSRKSAEISEVCGRRQRRDFQEVVWSDSAAGSATDFFQNVPLGTTITGLVPPQSLPADADAFSEYSIGNLMLGEVCREVHESEHVTNTETMQALSEPI